MTEREILERLADCKLVDEAGRVAHRWPNGDIVFVGPREPAPFIPGQRSNGLIALPVTFGMLARILKAAAEGGEGS